MTKTRNYDQIDDADPSAPSSKRARRSSSSEQEKPVDNHASVAAEGIPPPTSLAIHLSAPAPDATEVAKDNSDGESNGGSESEHSSHHGRVPSGIEGDYSPDTYAPSSQTPSQSGRVPSGIEGHYFPEHYGSQASSPPSNSSRVPSGIEGYYFPEYYSSQASLQPSNSGRVQSGIEGYYFPEYYGSEADDSSTVGSGKKLFTPEEAQVLFEKQYHFYNDREARKRGATIIVFAEGIINRPRGSPTAKDKVCILQDIARNLPYLGEDDFRNRFSIVLLNEARMIPKAGLAPGTILTLDDFEPDPRAWSKDFLGQRGKARFRHGAIPQAQPADGSFQKIFDILPQLAIPEPDLIFGLSAKLLPGEYTGFFNAVATKPLTKGIHHPFLAGEFKTQDRPLAEARVQCQRGGSAMVAYVADWNDEVSGKPKSEPLVTLPKVDLDKDTSIPDSASICFTLAIAPNICFLYVNWRETWSSGAVFWHTSVLCHYSLEAGMETETEKFQRHISNIVDWGIGERAEKIYEQTRVLSKRKVGTDDDLPVMKPKKQRTDGDDSSKSE